MDAGSLKQIHRLITMGSRSLLQYVSESFPWSAESGHAALEQVLAIAREERDETTRLTRLLQKQRLALPVNVSYPSHFTTINFVSLDYLLPRVSAEIEAQIAELHARLREMDDEEARALVQSFLDMKERHLQALRALTPLAA